jgi:hypothetical protein
MLGGRTTVKEAALLASPADVVTTIGALPVATPLGTGTTILELAQVVGVAEVVLNWMVPVVVPNAVPLTVIEAPIAPVRGATPVMLGSTVKFTPLLVTPLTVTVTGPVTAPPGTVAVIAVLVQFVVVACTLFVNLTVPLVPKPVPLMVTDEPIIPEGTDNPVITGAAKADETRNTATKVCNRREELAERMGTQPPEIVRRGARK